MSLLIKISSNVLTIRRILSRYITKMFNHLREHHQNNFVVLSGFWPLRGWEALSESIRKGRFVTKIFFSDNIE